MNARLEYTIPFTAGVHWDDHMIMNNYVARLYMITNSVDNVSQNVAFERIKYFIYSELNSTIFVSREHEDVCKKLIAAGLKITTLPGEPVDQIIGIMLYCKLNAVMENFMVINEIELSSDLGENMVHLHAADESQGPFEDAGWWHDSDLIHCDADLISNDKVVAIHRAGAWRELNLAWPDTESDEATDNTVVFAEFQNNETK
jgi:hypothetical protein